MSTRVTSEPPVPPTPGPLPSFDAAEFRRQLAGLADPTGGAAAGAPPDEFREFAARLGAVLADLFDRDTLDPLTLWDRIGSGFASAAPKAAGGDMPRFLSECASHVKAPPSKVAAHPAFGELLGQSEGWPPEKSQAFLAYLSPRLPVVLVYGRARWEAVKAKEVAL